MRSPTDLFYKDPLCLGQLLDACGGHEPVLVLARDQLDVLQGDGDNDGLLNDCGHECQPGEGII